MVLPGSRSTVADLATLRENGRDRDLAEHRRRGGRVVAYAGSGYRAGIESALDAIAPTISNGISTSMRCSMRRGEAQPFSPAFGQ